jgi:hypothetical protein
MRALSTTLRRAAAARAAATQPRGFAAAAATSSDDDDLQAFQRKDPAKGFTATLFPGDGEGEAKGVGWGRRNGGGGEGGARGGRQGRTMGRRPRQKKGAAAGRSPPPSFPSLLLLPLPPSILAGIGPEIADAVRAIFEAAAVPVTWDEQHIGTTVDPRTNSRVTRENLDCVLVCGE